MLADGRPANPEDLLIAYALEQEYVGQHGDDLARWTAAFGAWPTSRLRAWACRPPRPPRSRPTSTGPAGSRTR